MGCGEPAHHRSDEIADLRRGVDILDPRPRHHDVTRRALLHQQLSRLDDRLRVETVLHRSVVQDIRDRDQRHALMMRHVGANDRDVLALRQPRRGVIERFVVAERSASTRRGEASEIHGGRGGIDHRRQRRGVRCYHHFVAEPAFESQSGHAEVRVLVSELEIADVVRRLGHPPLARLPQQAAGGRAHDQFRHQVLEHRAGP